MSTLSLFIRNAAFRKAPLRQALIASSSSTASTIRSYTMIRKIEHDPSYPPPAETMKPPYYWKESDYEPNEIPKDPGASPNNPITSAYAIDTSSNALSNQDWATMTPEGTVLHGRYGQLPPELTSYLPLEYLALLHPAAEGAAALRTLGASHSGTLLVFGCGEPAASAALQLGSAQGLAVVGVVEGEKHGIDEFVDAMKAATAEPGFVVGEEFAIVKGALKEAVMECVEGETSPEYDPSVALSEFKENWKDYISMFPASLPAAVSRDMLIFKGKDRDRKYWKENMEAYLEQFGGTASPVSDAEMEQFTEQKYEQFKGQFLELTTTRVTDEKSAPFNPSEAAKYMCSQPQATAEESFVPPSEFTPYRFSPLTTSFSHPSSKKGGPIVGAVINVTPFLKAACETLSKATSLRAKAETLQFMSQAERDAFAAARSVVQLAEGAGAPVVVVGGELPGLTSVKVTEGDVEVALKGMDIQEGTDKADLNYFLQVFKAGDFPFYEEYAVHKASHVVRGPRQIIVTK